eukprot:8015807-Heterocapsa_arctica.AAC.1
MSSEILGTFDLPSQRIRAIERDEREKPQLLIGSPICTAVSCLQALNKAKMDPDQKAIMMSQSSLDSPSCLFKALQYSVSGRPVFPT